MKTTLVNPWTWQDNFGFSQAVEVQQPSTWLLCAGQAAISSEGAPVAAGEMRTQITTALDNLETVLAKAGRSLSDVVRLNVFAADVDALFANYDVITGRLAGAGCQPASTVLGVNRLAFPEMLVEIEATAAH